MAIFALTSVACAGGSPLLHPAHVLASGDVRAVGGMSAQAPVGSLANDVHVAVDQSTRGVPPGSTPEYTKGALVAASVAPGLAPFIGARVGIGNGFEGGVAYLGRGARLDMRHAWSNRTVALSVGAGFNAVFLGRTTGAPLPGVDFSSYSAFGFDVPIILGWRSTAGLYQVWGGVRGGYDHGSIAPVSSAPAENQLGVPYPMSVDHGYVGGLFGIAVGLHHVHVAFELDATYQFVSGTFATTRASTGGVVLLPGSALMWDF